MKIYAHAKSRPTTISTNKLRKGKFYVDRLQTEPIDIDIISDEYKDEILSYANFNNIPIRDLTQLTGEYIIDTQAAIDTAMLSDDEDLNDILVSPISSVVREACKTIESDLIKYSSDKTIVMVTIKLSIFGYAGYKLVLEDECIPITEEITREPLNSVWGINRLYATNGDEFLVISDAKANNSYFQRIQLRDIIKALAKPLNHLKKHRR